VKSILGKQLIQVTQAGTSPGILRVARWHHGRRTCDPRARSLGVNRAATHPPRQGCNRVGSRHGGSHRNLVRRKGECAFFDIVDVFSASNMRAACIIPRSSLPACRGSMGKDLTEVRVVFPRPYFVSVSMTKPVELGRIPWSWLISRILFMYLCEVQYHATFKKKNSTARTPDLRAGSPSSARTERRRYSPACAGHRVRSHQALRHEARHPMGISGSSSRSDAYQGAAATIEAHFTFHQLA